MKRPFLTLAGIVALAVPAVSHAKPIEQKSQAKPAATESGLSVTERLTLVGGLGLVTITAFGLAGIFKPGSEDHGLHPHPDQ